MNTGSIRGKLVIRQGNGIFESSTCSRMRAATKPSSVSMEQRSPCHIQPPMETSSRSHSRIPRCLFASLDGIDPSSGLNYVAYSIHLLGLRSHSVPVPQVLVGRRFFPGSTLLYYEQDGIHIRRCSVLAWNGERTVAIPKEMHLSLVPSRT